MATDRLVRVKEKAYHTKSNPLGYDTTLIDRKDFDYLVGEAEKVTPLKEEIKRLEMIILNSKDASRIEELEKVNERLKDSLKAKKSKGRFLGKSIKNFYCNGYFGRRYDLEGSTIVDIGDRHMMILLRSGERLMTHFDEEWDEYTDKMVAEWIGEAEDDSSYAN
ncbi:hypothetical protein BCSAG_49440 [Bacillus cereus]